MIRRAAICGILCLFCFAVGLQAGPVTSSVMIGGTTQDPAAPTGNCDPFGCPEFFGLGTYQQVYLATAFPGSMLIGSLDFFDSAVHNGAEPAAGDFTVSLSYTNGQPGNLDLTNPTNNVGPDSSVFFSGALPSLTATSTPGEREMTLTGTPFFYDPTLGNLLLTVTVTNPVDGFPYLDLDYAAGLTDSTNAYYGSFGNGGNTQGGLDTEFNPSAVPEPGTILLTLAGFGLIGLAWRRRLIA